MKFLILSSLSVLLVSAATAPTLRAETIAVNRTVNNTGTISQLNPFNLVHLAYRGYFRDQGIPGYSAFLSAYETGKVSSKDIVQNAVKKNKLSPQVLEDRGYLRAVEAHLERLKKD